MQITIVNAAPTLQELQVGRVQRIRPRPSGRDLVDERVRMLPRRWPSRLSHLQPPVALVPRQRVSRRLPEQPPRPQRQGGDQGRGGDHHQLHLVDSGEPTADCNF